MPINLENARDYDSHAVHLSVEVVDRVTAADLGRKTPCTDWDLGDLLAHMATQHRGFAASVQGVPADWTVRPIGSDPARAYRTASGQVLAAFAAVSDGDRPCSLPEVSPGPLPAALAIAIHAVDYFAHSWDVAATLGLPFTPDEDVADALLPFVSSIPDGEQRTEAGSAFAPGLPPVEGDAPSDRILRLLGRDPAWRP
ncbi:TIGR03086 family metal-binding protein [Cryptosporangium phraense]|uniref:TIGR03086 family protein n=1 Tax=Cryptosporangium phraense TaxID=2593070 RepID=A0A545B0Y1_9ACTN|nr:TIGR03086 family metal-binding protein [Cryptosporangium phraense]TQS46485.1 TIGR03086 family protein [Cryptosporangium phraense]